MIRIIGIDSTDYIQSTVEECYEYFKDKQYIQVDTETTGLNCHNDELMCLQLGDCDNQFVIHGSLAGEFKDLLEEKTLILQNSKFDLKFLYNYNIFPINIYDTYLAEAVLYCGIKLHKKGLNAIAKNRLGIDLDKSVRDNIWKKGLTKEVIEYAANDVMYLEKIKDHQEIELKQKDLVKTLELENQFVTCLAYIEYCGFKLDTKKWKAKIKKNLEELEKRKLDLNNYILENNIKEFIKIDNTIFGVEIIININWDSPTQVVKLFNKLGIDTTIVEKGIKKNSVEASNIEKYKDKFPIIPIYLKYKECGKVVSTYGENFLEHINQKTGRIHTNFSQIMDTGRLSSGGKNRKTGEEYINFQNIPRDSETRSCFIPEEENDLVIRDFSQQEQVLLANLSLDKSILEFYDNKSGDMHCFNAQKMYPELANLSLSEIKEKHSDKRQIAKVCGFAINYGASPAGIASQLNISLEDATNAYNAYFKAFPGLSEYFNKVKQQGLNDGFILIDSITSRKSYIYNYEVYLELKKELTRDFWEKWRSIKENHKKFEEGLYSVDDINYLEYKKKISTFFKIKGEIERKSLNWPVQGQAASLTKTSAILMFRWLRENNLLGIVKFCNQVHDENCMEAPKHMSELVNTKLEEFMKTAGELFCKRVPLESTGFIGGHWEH